MTASATNLASGSAQITVLGRTPLALKLYAQPSNMVTCQSSVVASCTGRLVIALTDENGNPTLAPRDITVYVRSSNLTVIVPQYSTTITAGSLSVDATYQSTANRGSAEITVSAPGLKSDFTTISTGGLVGALTGIQLYVGPAIVLANDRSYSSVVVSLINKTGFASVNDSGPTHIVLTSSRSDVGGISPLNLTIPEGVNYVAASFSSTFQVGSTDLTASAHNLLPSQSTISTYGAVPARVIVSTIFPTILADGGVHPALEVSLEDSHGAPAVAGSQGVQVALTSAPSGIAQVDAVTIEPGQSAALVNVTTTPSSGKNDHYRFHLRGRLRGTLPPLQT